MLHEAGQVQRDDAGPADLAHAGGLEAGDASRFLRDVLDRDVDPLVDDRLAEQADAQPRRARQERLDLLERVVELGDVAEENALVAEQGILLRRFGRRQQKVRELGRRVGFARGEVDAPAVALDQRLLVRDVRGLVEQQIRILGPLHVDVRVQRLDRGTGGRLVDDGDPVDDLERGHLQRAIVLVERHRALLRDVAVAGHGDDEHVAFGQGLFEVNEVTHVHEVERAVAEDDAPVAERGPHLAPVRRPARPSAAGRWPPSAPPAAPPPRSRPRHSRRPHSSAVRSLSVRSTSTTLRIRNALLSPSTRSINSIGTSTYVLVLRSAFTSTSA